MIKGINKQIIEIKCPKNEQFEKILLFVNAQNGRFSQAEIGEKAKLTAKRFLEPERGYDRRRRLSRAVKIHGAEVGLSAGAFMAGVLCAVWIMF